MNIGFDAKRAYHNTTGLGHFSRTLISLLADHFPEHHYFLFNPSRSGKFKIKGATVKQVLPSRLIDKLFRSAWRSSWVKRDLRNYKIDLYHGVSHEIPIGIHKTRVKSIVTIHDLIHERHPEQYNPIDVKIYHKKFRYSCKNSDAIMAISEQTKKDIVELYGIDSRKITVCYQSCNPVFAITASEEDKLQVKKKYGLPEKYFLYLGSITDRKNLLGICEAMTRVKDLGLPLLVVGDGGKYKQKVEEFINKNNLKEQVIIYSRFIPLDDLPEIYQSATALVYPSFFEGFGAPVLEALWSRLPVITSNTSSLPEVAGPGSLLVDPENPDEIANAMRRVAEEKDLQTRMKDIGWKHAQNFSPRQYVNSVMKLYESVC